MNLTFKTVSKDSFKLSLEPSETILAVKEKIANEKGYAASSLKLIYSGKILADNRTLESYGVTEKGFIVLMLSKARTPAAPKAEAPKVEAPKEEAPQTEVVETSTSQATEPATGSSSSGGILMGAQLAETRSTLMAMGFVEADVDRALRASFNNPERAVEYLTNGFPTSLEETATQASSIVTDAATMGEDEEDHEESMGGNLFEAAARASNAPAPSTGGQGAMADLSSLESNPQFLELRGAVQNQPELLQPLLEYLRMENPGLWQIVSQNPDEFIRLLTDGAPGYEDGGMMYEEGEEGAEGMEGEEGAGLQTITVTEEERSAISRLQELGFSEGASLTAYLACDKNEDLAANYLFEHMDDEF